MVNMNNLSEEEKKAIEYYQNKEVSLSVDFDTEKLLKALGITEEDSFENHQIRFKTLLNLVEKLQKENEDITQQRDYYKARYNELSKIVDSMAKHIYILGDYACLYEECDDNMDRECEDCIKEYFYKKVKETKDNGSTKKL